MKEWMFLTNHGLVLAYLYYFPGSTVREMALAIHITEWTVHKIINDLEKEGYVRRQKVGRSNIYHVDGLMPLKHDITCNCTVADLVKCFKSLPKQRMSKETHGMSLLPDF